MVASYFPIMIFILCPPFLWGAWGFLPRRADAVVAVAVAGWGFERCDELGQVPVGDPAQLADLHAAQLAGAEQAVDLVPPDVQHLRYLLDRVGLHVISPLLAL